MTFTGTTPVAWLFLLALGLTLAAGLCAAAGRGRRWSDRVGAWGGAAGGLMGLASALSTLLAGATWEMQSPWSVPGGALRLAVDPLSAFFLTPIFLVAALGAVYGLGYWRTAPPCRRAGGWLGYHVLTASMAVVATARNGVLFLVAWEVMTLASFLLVTFEHEKPEARRAGWIYLVAAHAGTACLFILFFLLGRAAGSQDFDRFLADGSVQPAWLFALALIGFGTKAGFVPLHVWLPEAHPAAPSHVSAVMSGVMIKTGIYGLLRALMWIGHPAPSWGWTLVGVGAVSGVLGVLYALSQHDLKRLLAYHSVENIGIIALGIGIGVVGLATGRPAVAALGLAGGLFHVWNHALFKSLLFLGAGAAAHATGTREIDRLGGLLRRMPLTGGAFLVGAAAISGLPPLNGFASEWLVFLGAFDAVRSEAASVVLSGATVLVALGLIGGLAAACFVKAFGIVFLGEPRSERAAGAREAGVTLRVPMAALAGLCVAVGLASPGVFRAVLPVARDLATGMLPRLSSDVLTAPAGFAALSGGAAVGGVLLALLAGLVLLRRRLLAGRVVSSAVTWDCGYAAPTPRMQYTAASFARPLLSGFGPLVRSREECHPPTGLFPRSAWFASHPRDAVHHLVLRPLQAWLAPWLERARRIQHGRVHLYVLYIALTLLVLLTWNLGIARP